MAIKVWIEEKSIVLRCLLQVFKEETFASYNCVWSSRPVRHEVYLEEGPRASQDMEGEHFGELIPAQPLWRTSLSHACKALGFVRWPPSSHRTERFRSLQFRPPEQCGLVVRH